MAWLAQVVKACQLRVHCCNDMLTRKSKAGVDEHLHPRVLLSLSLLCTQDRGRRPEAGRQKGQRDLTVPRPPPPLSKSLSRESKKKKYPHDELQKENERNNGIATSVERISPQYNNSGRQQSYTEREAVPNNHDSRIQLRQRFCKVER